MSEPRIKFGGEELAVPRLATLSFSDALALNRVCGVNAQEFALLAENPNETYIAGLIAIALRRAHPDWPVRLIEDMIGQAELDAWEWLSAAAAQEPESGPPPLESGGSSDPPDSTDSADESERPQG